MDLKDFVSETISSILDGVVAAQAKAKDMNAFVNPGGLMRTNSKISNNSLWDNRNNNFAQQISFDIAVTAEDSAQGGAKVKVLSGLIGGEAGGEKVNKNSTVSRVQFAVPILLPAHDVGDKRARNKKPSIGKPQVIDSEEDD